jgi:hypothetical protein
MKKSILFLTIASLFLSCSNSDSPGGGNSAGNVDYFFNININGVEHKVQGNTSGFGTGIYGNSFILSPNQCQAQISNTTQLTFKIADITKPNFVSGQTLYLVINIPNCQVGQNQADFVIFQSPVYDTFCSNSSIYSGTILGFHQNSGIHNYSGSTRNKITINITDMGTPSTSSAQGYNYGNTFKGNFTGPVYLSSTFLGGQMNDNIPMQLDMSFSAYRL